MQLVGGNSHFGAEAVFATVGKAGACVHHHAAAVHVRDKVVLHGGVFGNDGFGVAAAVLFDVVAGFGDVIDELDACLEGEVFVVVVAVVADVCDAAVVALGILVAEEFHAAVGEAVNQFLDVGVIDMAVDNHAFHGVAHAGALRLGVDEDVHRLVDVGGLVHVHVADAVEVLDHGNLALFHDGADQAFAAAGNHEVDAVVTLQEHAHQVVARFGHELHGVFANAVCGKRFVENPGEALRGVERFLAAAQNHGIARLEAEACAVNRHVRAAFENKEYGADRHGHAANLDAVLEFAAFEHAVQRVGKGGNFFGTLGHGLDTGVVQCEAVHLRVVELSGGGFEVELVGGQNLRFFLADELCHEVQHGAPLLGGQRAEVLACVFGVICQNVRVLVQVGIFLSHNFNIEIWIFSRLELF